MYSYKTPKNVLMMLVLTGLVFFFVGKIFQFNDLILGFVVLLMSICLSYYVFLLKAESDFRKRVVTYLSDYGTGTTPWLETFFRHVVPTRYCYDYEIIAQDNFSYLRFRLKQDTPKHILNFLQDYCTQLGTFSITKDISIQDASVSYIVKLRTSYAKQYLQRQVRNMSFTLEG